MARPKRLFFITLYFSLFLVNTHFSICNGVPVFGLNSLKIGEIEAIPRRVCGGRVGECLPAAEETETDSETNRRVLMMRKKYISYETLKKDMVPCERPGASYYNCRGAGRANPYNRGCEVITYCARDVRDSKT